jgi:uncharacterized protein (DUF1778 family)
MSDIKTVTLTVRLTPALRELLGRAAQTEERTMSDLARRIIAQWLRRQQPKR